jgi:hypothetical protein
MRLTNVSLLSKFRSLFQSDNGQNKNLGIRYVEELMDLFKESLEAALVSCLLSIVRAVATFFARTINEGCAM